MAINNCKNNVTNSDQAIQCDLSDSWAYMKCNDLNFIDYKFLQNSNDPWFCISCCSEISPFSTVKNKNFISNFYDSNKANNIVDKDSSLLLKPSEHVKPSNLQVFSSASDKAKLFAENFSLNSNLDDSGVSLPVFPSRTNLKLHNISITPKMVRKVIMNLDLSKASGPDSIPVVVLKNCEPELS